MEISPNGQFIASAGCTDDRKECFLIMWNVLAGTEVFRIALDPTYRLNFNFEPNGNFIYIIEDSLRIYDTKTGHKIDDIAIGAGQIVKFNPNQQQVILSGCNANDEVNEDCSSVFVRVLDVATGKESIQHVTTLGQLFAVSPDGKYIVSAPEFGVSVREVATSDEKFSTDNWKVSSVEFTQDGRYIALITFGTIHVLDLANGQELIDAPFDTGTQPYAFFSPDGNHLIVTGGQSGASVWEIPSGKEVTRIPQLSAFDRVAHVSSIARFSPDSMYFVSNTGKVAIVFETATGQEIARMTHDNWVVDVAFSPSGQYVVSADEDQMIRIWNLVTGYTNEKFQPASESHLTLSENSKYILTTNCQTRGPGNNCLQVYAQVWKTDTRKLVSSFPIGGVDWLSLSPSGKHIELYFCRNRDKTGSCAGSQIIVKETLTGKEIFNKTSNLDSVYFAFNPDETYFVWDLDDNIAHVEETSSGQEVAALTIEGIDQPADYILSPDGLYLITTYATYAKIWEVKTGKELNQLEFEEGSLVILSPNGQYVFARRKDNDTFDATSHVWEVATGKEIKYINNAGSFYIFGPNSKYMASIDAIHNTVYVWNTATGEEVNHKASPIPVENLEFSPDNKYLIYVSSDSFSSTIYAWDFVQGNNVTVMRNNRPNNDTRPLPISPDNKYLVSHDGTVWDIASGEQVANKNNPYTYSRDFIVNGKFVVSNDFNDGFVNIWRWRRDDVIEMACEFLPRNLSLAEWQQYVGLDVPYKVVCDPETYPNAIVPKDAQEYLNEQQK